MNAKINLNDLKRVVDEMIRCRDNGVDACTDDVRIVDDGFDTIYFRQQCAYSDGLPRVTQIKAELKNA